MEKTALILSAGEVVGTADEQSDLWRLDLKPGVIPKKLSAARQSRILMKP